LKKSTYIYANLDFSEKKNQDFFIFKETLVF